MKTTHRIISSTLVLLSLGFLFVLAPRAEAHAHLVKSMPEKGAVLAKGPGQIDLWFNELLEDGFNTVLVYPSSELGKDNPASLTEGKVMVDPKDRTHLMVKVGTLKPGDYVVDWRVLSRDGHSAPGRITFAVKGGK